MYINKAINWQYNYILNNYNKNLYTNLFGMARSILGLSLLLTLIFNKFDTLYPQVNGEPSNYLIKLDSIFNTLNFFLLAGLDNIKLMYYVAIIILTFVVIGFSPAISCIFHWWIQYSFNNSSSCIDGGDQIGANISLLLIPVFLFDKRLWHWKNDNIDTINSYKLILSNLMFKLIRLQMCVIYFHAATGKFNVTEWSNGTAIYYWVNSSFFKMSPNLADITMFLFSFPAILAIITWGIIILELLLAFSIISAKKYRKPLFITALILHFGFLLYFGLISFFLVMFCGLIFYLVNPSFIFNFKKHVSF